MRPVSIRAKFARDLVLMVLLMSGAVVLVFWIGNRRAVRTLSASIIRQTLQTTEQELQSFFEPVTLSLRVAQSWGEDGDLDLVTPIETSRSLSGKDWIRDQLRERFIPVIQQMPRISSLLVADESGREFMLLHTAAGFEIWQTQVLVDGSLERQRTWSDHQVDDAGVRTDYDPRTRPWFVGAVEQMRQGGSPEAGGGVFWTEPYTFFTTGEPGITASIPLRNAAGHVQVIGFDILLRDISQFTRSLRVSEQGKVVVMTMDNLVVGLPDDPRFDDPAARRAAVLKRPSEIGLDLARDATSAFEAAAEKSQLSPDMDIEMTVRFKSGGEAWWGESRRFTLSPERHLRMAVVVPESELLGNVVYQRLILSGVLIAVLGMGVWRAVAIGRILSAPVEQLVAQTDRIGSGDLSVPDPILTDIAEIRRLAGAHDRMRQSLQSLMKLERDIQIARQIQQSTFPRSLPILEGFDLDAWNEPADETGGDTFDVIGFSMDAVGVVESATKGKLSSLADESAPHAQRAVLLLADATGHGIGPALAATQIRAMLRMAVRLGVDLQQLAQQLNEQLVADLPDNRFITAWLGQVDASSGTITTFSAGQGPLLHYRAASRDFVTVATDAPPFGVVAELVVRLQPPIKLRKGDLFVVVSDGLFEARDSTDEQFGLERMKSIIAATAHRSAADITSAVRRAVDEFTGHAPADDDRTIIIIQRTT